MISRFSIFGTAAPQSGQTINTYVRNPLHPNLNLTKLGGREMLVEELRAETDALAPESVRRGLADPIADQEL